MYFRSILSGTLAILLVSGATVQADDRVGLLDALKPDTAETGLSLSKLGLPKLFGGKEKPAGTVELAQAGDPRITALEEQVRALSGTIEELNFQILQMQEQMRKMQEDNEFRFQELEQKKTDAGAPAGTKAPSQDNVASAPADPAASPPADVGQAAAAQEEEEAPGVPMEPEVLVDNRTGDPADVPSGAGGAEGLGAPPKEFGTITFDDKGNVTGGSVADQTTQSVPNATDPVTGQPPVRQAIPNPAAGEAPAEPRMAALPATDDPEELYRNSYEFILSGDYGTAEEGFRDHIARFPSDAKAADANFWLGEALLGQKKYRDAAETFLSANKQYPSSKKAPDMLLKLGVSLVGLDQRDVACATFSEIGKRYPDISGALKERVKQEQALAAC
ncbi:tol-pal system protein YbgF [Mesorhizobium sp. KR9-304]|uniref:tol-pal system protein YbgF n=1 Tax=Mesorhizobium sp. KR9-304 TaxID=3156614 RepID=UPI0032B5139D